MENQQRLMHRAIELALQGEGFVEPNPMVGCVLVRDGQIIGEGWHEKFGGPHAEIMALRSCNDPSGATAYVTLEPCSHVGKTGPCAKALVEANVGRVVIATADPNPQVNGRGIGQLEAAGIPVEVGICQQAANQLIRPFVKRIQTGLPWIIAKWAMTLDGKIATASGSSQWISNESSRQIVHKIRGRVDAVMVGIGTVLADDPLLTARPPGPRIAKRVVVDSTCRIPHDSQLVQSISVAPVIIGASANADSQSVESLRECGCTVNVSESESRPVQVRELLTYLCEQGGTNVLVEGGSGLFGVLNDENLIDEVHCFIAPKIAGGEQGMTAFAGMGVTDMSCSKSIENPTIQQIEDDVYVSGRISSS